MKFEPTPLPGVLVIEPVVHKDSRGFFLETYHAERYRAGGVPLPFVQDNHSRSVRNTLRGMHAQIGRPQGKLVRVIAGEIFDVAVDIRPDSPTFRHWFGASLSAENFLQMYVPPGYAHGFCVLSEIAEVEYKCTDFYDPKSEVSFAWNDPIVNVGWPVRDPILSARDSAAPTLDDLLRRITDPTK